MADHKTVFISYRRIVSSYIARAIFQDLRSHGFDVFMDVESIDAGHFETIIINQIQARAHFIVILSPGTVERCIEGGDWLRREIEYAMECGRNIVPILANDFRFDGTKSYLTGALAELSRFNALTLHHEYFEEGMERLRTRFLKQRVLGRVVPTPPEDREMVEKKIAHIAKQGAPTPDELSAEECFNRGTRKLHKGECDAAIDDFSEAIALNDRYAKAYYNRGLAHFNRGQLDAAIDDYDIAIQLETRYAEAHFNRASARVAKGDRKGAAADYERFLELGGGQRHNNEPAVRDRIAQLRRSRGKSRAPATSGTD
jgi:tetratricopeptide (TPR) repeat protein